MWPSFVGVGMDKSGQALEFPPPGAFPKTSLLPVQADGLFVEMGPKPLLYRELQGKKIKRDAPSPRLLSLGLGLHSPILPHLPSFLGVTAKVREVARAGAGELEDVKTWGTVHKGKIWACRLLCDLSVSPSFTRMIKVLRQKRGSNADTGNPYGLCLALEHTIQLAMGPKLPSPQKKSHYMRYTADRILWPFLKEDDARSGTKKTSSGPGDHLVLRMDRTVTCLSPQHLGGGSRRMNSKPFLTAYKIQYSIS